MITITFEDHGQDFLEWDIEKHRVIGCRPFQASVWVGLLVFTSEPKLRAGGRVTVLADGKPREINYRIEKVSRRVVRRKGSRRPILAKA